MEWLSELGSCRHKMQRGGKWGQGGCNPAVLRVLLVLGRPDKILNFLPYMMTSLIR